MDIDALILVILSVVALPAVGTVLAMTLGIVIAVSRRRHIALTGTAGAVLDRLEPRLLRGAALFGCTVDGARTTPERRMGERRARSPRRQSRADADRRHRDRRARDRREQDRRQRRDAASPAAGTRPRQRR